ncbi:CaiB/BaiF CoA transferase family protein [Streptomyces mirabilis]|uniref:CaiB/BaiF CoA transferase family protein n=1 Tax=Streptomyces mirabilis TaxID=68239 RepID=UPI0036528994
MPVPGQRGPLSGLVVVDLSRAVAGPHAAMMLGDLGARVIKVELPGAGDDARGWGPPFVSEGGATAESTYFLSANRNKESIALDLKDPDDLSLLWAMVDRADVVVENFRTGVLDRLGLGFAALHRRNPRLVVLSITGFGHDGPEGGRAGYDQIAQGEAGLMSITGSAPSDPQKSGTPIADILAGMYGAYGVMSALFEREGTGEGRLVRTSLLAAVVGAHGYQGTRWTVGEELGRAQGNHHPSLCPYGLFPTADGFVQIAIGSERLWHNFCEGLGLDPAAPGMATNADRVRNHQQVIALVGAAFAERGTDELLGELDRLGIPAGRIRSIADVYAWEQTRSQGLVVDVSHQTLGTISIPGPPLRFFDLAGAEQTRRAHRAPPVLNADESEIRAWALSPPGRVRSAPSSASERKP